MSERRVIVVHAIDTFLRPRPGRHDGKPTCSLCLEVYGEEVRMVGPVSRLDRTREELYFVCLRCNTCVKERRRWPPDEIAEA